MNIIGNTCCGSWLTQTYFKEPFSNPFCWNVIRYESLYKLIKNYDSIDFNKYELSKDTDWKFYILVDGQIKIEYPHYKFSPNTVFTKTNDHDILSNKIWEYIVEKYQERTERLLQKKENPIFVIQNILQQNTDGGTIKRHKKEIEQKLQSIINLNSTYKIIIVEPSYMKFDLNLQQNCAVIKSDNYTNTRMCAEAIFKAKIIDN